MPEEQPQPAVQPQQIIIQTPAAGATTVAEPVITEPKEPKKQIHAGFWSFSELFIVKQLATAMHVLAQLGGTGYLFYYIYDTKIYLLALATPLVWITIRFAFEFLVVPFVISYDLDKILRKLTEDDE